MSLRLRQKIQELLLELNHAKLSRRTLTIELGELQLQIYSTICG